jgi:AraC-like DNA-binding protein
MKPDIASRYHARMQRVLSYVDAHLDDDLDVDLLSGVAAFSKYHFHRQFTSLFGISIHRYVQLLRLQRASYRLAFAGDPVLEVALDSGYGGPEAFARAFKLHHDQSPTAFRNAPQWTRWHETYQPLNRARSAIMQPAFTDNDVRIIQFPETPGRDPDASGRSKTARRHHSPFHRVAESQWAIPEKERNLQPAAHRPRDHRACRLPPRSLLRHRPGRHQRRWRGRRRDFSGTLRGPAADRQSSRSAAGGPVSLRRLAAAQRPRTARPSDFCVARDPLSGCTGA